MSCNKLAAATLIGIMASLACTPAQAFKLRPTGTENEALIVELSSGFWGTSFSKATRYLVDHFSSNVHEEITQRIWGCSPPAGADPRDQTCIKSAIAPAPVIYGVQWNDNPPFKLDKTGTSECEVQTPIRLPDRQPNCWAVLFHDATKKAKDGEIFSQKSGHALLYRSHFGDMQFLHAMASWNGEKMSDARDRIMMWSEFTYKTAIGDISPKTPLNQISIPMFSKVLGLYWGDVETLFTYGVTKYSGNIADVAFGSFLHMVEDSFSQSHTTREMPSGRCDSLDSPNGGRVIAFNAYGNQDSGKHGHKDSRDLMLAGLAEVPANNVVAIGRHLKDLREKQTPWDNVRDYLAACVFMIVPGNEDDPAGPGPFK